MTSWQERTSFGLLAASGVVFVCLAVGLILKLTDLAPSLWGLILFAPWYYTAALGLLLIGLAKLSFGLAPERKLEAAHNEKVREKWNSFYNAFMTGKTAEYPAPKVTDYGFMLQPGERAYMATSSAVLGVGSTHQMERTESAGVGVDFKALKTDIGAATKDSYATIRYDENHPGALMITNQRVSFVSAPSVFIELLPDKIQSVACNVPFVMMRTTLTADESKNLIAIRISEGIPAWLFAAAIYRLRADYLSARA